jgi:hypothetical protein
VSPAFADPPTHPPIEPAPPADATGLNRSLLKFVEDDAPPRTQAENRDEYLAYDYVVRYAKDVPVESFRQAARTDLSFANLLGPEAAKYRGEVVHVEGRLKRLRDIGPTAGLAADGVEHLYEGWIFSEQYREYSYCVLFTELPSEMKVAEDLDKRVRFEGYFYKVYRFRAADGPRRAALLIGRTISLRTNPTSDSIWTATGSVMSATIGLVVIALAGLAALVWWFRHDDHKSRQAVQKARGFPQQDPFEGT